MYSYKFRYQQFTVHWFYVILNSQWNFCELSNVQHSFFAIKLSAVSRTQSIDTECASQPLISANIVIFALIETVFLASGYFK